MERYYKISSTAANQIQRMYRWWLVQRPDAAKPRSDLSTNYFSDGCTGKLTADIDGFTVNATGVTGEAFAGYKKGTARVWFPHLPVSSEDSEDIPVLNLQEQTDETEEEGPESVDVWNTTPYDLKTDEEVRLAQLPTAWLITAPVRPTLARFTLTADLTAAGMSADATCDWGTETVKVKSGDLTSGKKIASGKTVWAQRLKDGFYVVSAFACES